MYVYLLSCLINQACDSCVVGISCAFLICAPLYVSLNLFHISMASPDQVLVGVLIIAFLVIYIKSN